jgi:hypothetical protein
MTPAKRPVERAEPNRPTNRGGLSFEGYVDQRRLETEIAPRQRHMSRMRAPTSIRGPWLALSCWAALPKSILGEPALSGKDFD